MNDQTNTPSPIEIKSEVDKLERKVSGLKNILRCWKADFKERNGKSPTGIDIRNNPVILKNYKRYENLSKRLKRQKLQQNSRLKENASNYSIPAESCEKRFKISNTYSIPLPKTGRNSSLEDILNFEFLVDENTSIQELHEFSKNTRSSQDGYKGIFKQKIPRLKIASYSGSKTEAPLFAPETQIEEIFSLPLNNSSDESPTCLEAKNKEISPKKKRKNNKKLDLRKGFHYKGSKKNHKKTNDEFYQPKLNSDADSIVSDGLLTPSDISELTNKLSNKVSKEFAEDKQMHINIQELLAIPFFLKSQNAIRYLFVTKFPYQEEFLVCIYKRFLGLSVFNLSKDIDASATRGEMLLLSCSFSQFLNYTMYNSKRLRGVFPVFIDASERNTSPLLCILKERFSVEEGAFPLPSIRRCSFFSLVLDRSCRKENIFFDRKISSDLKTILDYELKKASTQTCSEAINNVIINLFSNNILQLLKDVRSTYLGPVFVLCRPMNFYEQKIKSYYYSKSMPAEEKEPSIPMFSIEAKRRKRKESLINLCKGLKSSFERSQLNVYQVCYSGGKEGNRTQTKFLSKCIYKKIQEADLVLVEVPHTEYAAGLFLPFNVKVIISLDDCHLKDQFLFLPEKISCSANYSNEELKKEKTDLNIVEKSNFINIGLNYSFEDSAVNVLEKLGSNIIKSYSRVEDIKFIFFLLVQRVLGNSFVEDIPLLKEKEKKEEEKLLVQNYGVIIGYPSFLEVFSDHSMFLDSNCCQINQLFVFPQYLCVDIGNFSLMDYLAREKRPQVSADEKKPSPLESFYNNTFLESHFYNSSLAGQEFDNVFKKFQYATEAEALLSFLNIKKGVLSTKLILLEGHISVARELEGVHEEAAVEMLFGEEYGENVSSRKRFSFKDCLASLCKSKLNSNMFSIERMRKVGTVIERDIGSEITASIDAFNEDVENIIYNITLLLKRNALEIKNGKIGLLIKVDCTNEPFIGLSTKEIISFFYSSLL